MTASHRELIDAVSVAYWALRRAETSDAQRSAAIHLRAAAEPLRESCCRADKDTTDVLPAVDLLLARKQREFDAADAAWQAMAFGGEWR